MSAVLEAHEPSAKYLSALQPKLVQQFELLGTAPGGVVKLRELILTLAVRGKLVQQDPSDEPASDLLKKIQAERERLVVTKTIRRAKPMNLVDESEYWFELPRTWVWERLGNLGDWGAGATPSRTNNSYYGGNIPWFKSGELTADFISDAEETVTDQALRECSLRLNAVGDVLIAMYGATIGKTSILSVAATTNQAVCACTPFGGLSNTYLLLLMKALKQYFISIGAGGAQPNISREKVISTVVGLPPLAEQSRIVTRVEELMRLCDALEAKGHLEAAQHVQLVQTLLGALTASATPDELADNWQRVATHFDLLLDRPEAVDALEQTILQLAVRGLLVRQDPNDEPASVLLQRIRNKKERPLAKSNAKQDESFSEIKEAEQPFDLPNGWEWVRMGNLIEGGSGTTPLRARSDYFAAGTEMWVKTTDLNNGVVTSCEELITKTAVVENRLKYFPAGTVCVAMYGGAGTIGKSGVLGVASTINQSVFALPPAEGIDSDFLHTYVISVRSKWMSFAAGLRKDPNINGQIIKRMVMPLPPLAEQLRIVARVESLRCLCADLRQRLAARKTTQAHLAEALIDEVA